MFGDECLVNVWFLLDSNILKNIISSILDTE